MLFRDKNGILIEIVRANYNNDKTYYNAILMLKQDTNVKTIL